MTAHTPKIGDVWIWSKGYKAACTLFIVSVKSSGHYYTLDCFTVAQDQSYWPAERDGIETWTFAHSEFHRGDALELVSRA